MIIYHVDIPSINPYGEFYATAEEAIEAGLVPVHQRINFWRVFYQHNPTPFKEDIRDDDGDPLGDVTVSNINMWRLDVTKKNLVKTFNDGPFYKTQEPLLYWEDLPILEDYMWYRFRPEYEAVWKGLIKKYGGENGG